VKLKNVRRRNWEIFKSKLNFFTLSEHTIKNLKMGF
jgi:hypothetical protein